MVLAGPLWAIVGSIAGSIISGGSIDGVKITADAVKTSYIVDGIIKALDMRLFHDLVRNITFLITCFMVLIMYVVFQKIPIIFRDFQFNVRQEVFNSMNIEIERLVTKHEEELRELREEFDKQRHEFEEHQAIAQQTLQTAFDSALQSSVQTLMEKYGTKKAGRPVKCEDVVSK